MLSDEELSRADFDAKSCVESFLPNDNIEQIIEILESKLEQNTDFFARQMEVATLQQVQSSLRDVTLVAEIQSEALKMSIMKYNELKNQIDSKVGRIVLLSQENNKVKFAITNTRQLQMMNSSLEQCAELKNEKRFAEIAKNILAVEQLLDHFSESDSSAAEVKSIKVKLSLIKDLVGGAIIEAFASSLDDSGNLSESKPGVLSGCCLLADVLENDYSNLLIKCFLEKQFFAYRKLFPSSLQVNELKNLANRFAWCKRVLSAYERIFYHIFPNDWNVEILLSQAVGNWVKEDIVSILSSVPDDRRVSDEIFMLALTSANSFDRFLTLKFRNKFTSTVAQAFHDFHFFLFEAKEDEFVKLKDKLLPKDSVKSLSKVIRKDHLLFANFDQIFLFLSNTLETFSTLSNSILMVQMSFFLSDCVEALNAYFQSQIEVVKKKASKKWIDEYGKLLCALINTIDYCLANINDLREKLLSYVLIEDLRQHIVLEPVKQRLLISQSQAFSCILSHLDGHLEILMGRFKKTNWPDDFYPSDPSPFVTQILQYFANQTRFGVIQVGSSLKPATSELFYERYIQLFFDRLKEVILSFKLVTEVMAEQFLIDLFGFRSYFADFFPPSNWSSKETSKWKAALVQLTSQYELLIKILLTPAEPMEQFVQSYILLLTDSATEAFARVLTVKGVTKTAEQQVFLDEFNKHIPPTPSGESFLKQESSRIKTNNWGDNLMSKLKDISLSHLRSYSRNKEVREPRDGHISPTICQPNERNF